MCMSSASSAASGPSAAPDRRRPLREMNGVNLLVQLFEDGGESAAAGGRLQRGTYPRKRGPRVARGRAPRFRPVNPPNIRVPWCPGSSRLNGHNSRRVHRG